MIHYLRKIRRNLLGEGKFKKYLFYATGEVFLVVVGILIALQLNNWNQKRINRKLEILYYKSMKDQLNEDKGELVNTITYNQNYLDQFNYAKNILIVGDRTRMDTLGKIALGLTSFSDFRRKSNVYQKTICLTLTNSRQDFYQTYDETHYENAFKKLLTDI